MISEIYKQCTELSLIEISELRDKLSLLYEDKFDSMYKKVYVYPSEQMEEKIKKETGFHCYHNKCNGYSNGKGTHVIVIPIEQYSYRLRNELINRYDDYGI